MTELAHTGMTAHQVTSHVTNLNSRSAGWLADVAVAAEVKDPQLASLALADWALCVANVYMRFERHHPLYDSCIQRFGPRTPWDGAREVVSDEGWQAFWVNQLYGKPEFVIHVLNVAEANVSGDWGPVTAEVFDTDALRSPPAGPFIGWVARRLSALVELTLDNLAEGTLAGTASPPPRPLRPSASPGPVQE
jgi:hypothetical protein